MARLECAQCNARLTNQTSELAQVEERVAEAKGQAAINRCDVGMPGRALTKLSNTVKRMFFGPKEPHS